MKNTVSFFLLAIALVGLAGCNSSSSGGGAAYKPKERPKITPASVQPGNEAVLFPVNVGTRWRYELRRVTVGLDGTRTSVNEEVTMEVADVKDTPNGKRAVIELKQSDVTTDRQVWDITKNGIYQVQIGLERPFSFTPPQPAILFPIKINEEAQYQGRGPTPFGEIGDVKTTQKVTGPEEVDTASDRVSAFRVENQTRYGAGNGRQAAETSVVFWSPNVGLVRYRQEIGASLTQNVPGQPSRVAGVRSSVTMTLIQKTGK